jgi:hypothetical protein
LRAFIALLIGFVLTGCSYDYTVNAVVLDGRLAFVVAPTSRQSPDCYRQVTVRNDQATLWQETVADDDACENRFPIFYGAALNGRPMLDASGRVPEWATSRRSRPLQRGVWYEINATSGSTGYGRGRFRISAEGRVENDPVAGR